MVVAVVVVELPLEADRSATSQFQYFFFEFGLSASAFRDDALWRMNDDEHREKASSVHRFLTQLHQELWFIPVWSV